MCQEGWNNLCVCKLCKQYCYPLLAGNFFSLLLFYFIFFSPWFLTTCHLEFPLWSCHQCQRDCFIIAYCINTAQSSVNPLLVSKITKQGQTGSFSLFYYVALALPCSAGTLWPVREVMLWSYSRIFGPSLCCVKTWEARGAIPAKRMVCWINLPAALHGRAFCG